MQAQSPSFEHGFARDYAQSRAAFVQAARQAGARHWQVMHPDRGMQGEALSMDLAWLGPASAQRVLVSLSGTHGIEGFAGSACQRAWLATDLNPQGGVFCPSPKADMKLWNSHPKVYLDVAKTGEAKCPYCGTVYKLKAGEHFGGGH